MKEEWRVATKRSSNRPFGILKGKGGTSPRERRSKNFRFDEKSTRMEDTDANRLTPKPRKKKKKAWRLTKLGRSQRA